MRRHVVVIVLSCLLAVVAVFALAPHRAAHSQAMNDLQSLLDRSGIDLPFDPQLAAVSCPYERGPVKEGSDTTRNKVSTTVVSTTISYLRGRAKPAHYPRTTRVGGAEYHTYQVHAYLTQYKVEAD